MTANHFSRAIFTLFLLIGSASAFAQNRCDSVFTSPAVEFRKNLFESLHGLQAAQKTALKVLAESRDGGSDPQLTHAAKEKLGTYQHVRGAKADPQLSQFETEVIRRDAMEFVVQTFRSPDDAPLRTAAIAELARHSAADASTINVLMTSARGATAPNGAEITQATQAIAQIHSRLNAPSLMLTARNDLRRTGRPELLEALRSATVESVKPLGNGNANATIVITFRLADGGVLRGVFKSLEGENTRGKVNQILFTREIQAFDFFTEHLSHPDIAVPETLEVIFKHEGKYYGPGSLQLFVEGAVTVNAYYGGERPAKGWQEYHHIWEKQRVDRRWSEIAPWIQVFDWIMGNSDRFPNSHYNAGNPNNLMMKETAEPGSSLKAYLIDNGNGRREARQTFGEGDIPKASIIPKALKDKLRSMDDAKIEAIRRQYADVLSPEGLNEMINRLRIVRDRVRN